MKWLHFHLNVPSTKSAYSVLRKILTHSLKAVWSGMACVQLIIRLSDPHGEPLAAKPVDGRRIAVLPAG
jgi:hypothetical protein